MTGWDEIKKEYIYLFKAEPSNWQLRLFYFGQIRAAYKDPRRAEITIKLQAHRQQIEREVAPWDVSVRLAFLYIYKQIKKKKLEFKGGFTYDKLNRMIYKTLWSDFRRTRPVRIKGEEKHLPTFWSWAIEHKNSYDPGIADRNVRKMDRYLSMALKKINKKGAR